MARTCGGDRDCFPYVFRDLRIESCESQNVLSAILGKCYVVRPQLTEEASKLYD
jgi:hypothetical protein